jgi:hypothetical protein
MGNEEYEFLVVIHELVECMLCKFRGINESAVDQWDKSFTGIGEPGDDPLAPYHREHTFATSIEKLVAQEIGVDWDTYEVAIAALCESVAVPEGEE